MGSHWHFWDKEKIEYIFECRKNGKSQAETAAMLFAKYGRDIKGNSVGRYIGTVRSWIYMLKDVMNREEAIDDYVNHLKKSTRIMWKQNPKYLKTVEDNFDLPLQEIAYILFTEYKIKPTITALWTIRGRLYKEDLLHRTVPKYKYEGAGTIHPDIYIMPGFIVEHAKQNVPVICYAKGHETIKNNASLQTTGCGKCAGSFVGGKPTGPQPALVYLLIFLVWKKCKLGYAEIGSSLSPEEAINRTSKYRRYPYPYTIGAYDLSTKTEAGDLEEELKAQTEESRSFIEAQEFVGWTEFRNIEVVKQILPQFKTVLDTALKI